MQLSEVAYIINATQFYYPNLLRRLMLCLLLVILDGDTSVASRLTSLLPTPSALLFSCLITYFLRGCLGLRLNLGLTYVLLGVQ
jgi:hypothetical protein